MAGRQGGTSEHLDFPLKHTPVPSLFSFCFLVLLIFTSPSLEYYLVQFIQLLSILLRSSNSDLIQIYSMRPQ